MGQKIICIMLLLVGTRGELCLGLEAGTLKREGRGGNE